MRILKHDLKEDYLPGVPLKWDDPSVSYRETVTSESSQICLSKSPNKHNRLFIKAEPMTEEVNLAIEANRINPNQEAKARAKILDKEFGWDKTDALKIWGSVLLLRNREAAMAPTVLLTRPRACSI